MTILKCVRDVLMNYILILNIFFLFFSNIYSNFILKRSFNVVKNKSYNIVVKTYNAMCNLQNLQLFFEILILIFFLHIYY